MYKDLDKGMAEELKALSKDEKLVEQWLRTPKRALQDMSPQKLIEDGKPEDVWVIIERIKLGDYS